ncbi:hypothetical protein CcCBS67573_g10458 [Chytriomyces confervae]|uniref:Uncharacterized protein n=1 Tax=Chytriomyces confervae TaxID=246404 RepID=A0A507CWE6_9FUNG|nr:hypothetical protein CcCBS67573_g10458 [Chytriomyces confervae]
MAADKDPKRDPTRPSKQPALRADRIMLYASAQSSLVFAIDATSNSLVVAVFNSPSPEISRSSILHESSSAILSFFSHTKVSPNRLIYATAGIMFQPASPKPFGGSKVNPGYVSYNGTDAASLLHFAVSASFKWYWACRGRDAIDFLASSVNKARRLHFAGNVDILNELMLKGMQKAGHIVWNKAAIIPVALRHWPEEDPNFVASGVLFTPRRRGRMFE